LPKEIDRNERTIWTSYKKAKEKQAEPFSIKEKQSSCQYLHSGISNLTILESIILYMKEKGMKYSENS